MASPKFRFERKDIKQKCIHQILLKNFEKIYKKFAEKLKNYPKFFKNKIEQNLRKFYKIRKIC